MKLINSKKEINTLIKDDHESEAFFDFDEEIRPSPCWEVKIDRERDEMIFLTDGQEKLSFPLSKIDDSFLTVEKISELISIFRNGNVKELRKVLGTKRR